MAFTTASTRTAADSGAGLALLNDANLATVAGASLAAVTGGGALFVGAAVAPMQVLGGTAVAGTFLALGETKRRTGAYLPFLGKKSQETAPAVEPAAA